MVRVLFLISFFLNLVLQAESQEIDSLSEAKNYQIQLINGDTVYLTNLPPIYLYVSKDITDIKELQKYSRLVRNVRKVYPYAKLFHKEIMQIEKDLILLRSKKDKQAYMDSTEKKLRVKFEKDLVGMTVTQGRILIKLLYRETGNTSYDLLKEMKGSFPAFFWQSVARLFGSSLKAKYDPLGEDKDIEAILVKIESGQ
jgi:hypothetical protein